MRKVQVNDTSLSELKLSLYTNVDEDELNSYIDALVEQCRDKWSDLSQDYNLFEEYILDQFDVDYLFESGIIKIESEFLKTKDD